MDRGARHWRLLIWIGFIIVMLWLLSSGLMLLEDRQTSSFQLESYSASASFAGEYDLNGTGPPTVTVRGGTGDIKIRGGADLSVLRREFTKIAFATSEDAASNELDNVTVTSQRDGDDFQFSTVQQTTSGRRSNQVDLTLIVPSETQLDIYLGTGDLTIEQITVPDALSARTVTGNIVLDDVSALAGMDIQADAGSLAFGGHIGANGDYALTATIGDLIVRLPAETDAVIDAYTTLGTITVERLVLDDQTEELQGGSSALQGVLGDGGPTLVLRNRLGNIHIIGY